MPPLRDATVVLRPWQEEDAQWYVDAVRDPDIQRFTSEPPTLTVEQVRAAIAAARQQPAVAGFAICDAATGGLLGNVGLSIEDGVGHVSYWVGADGRGRGVATRAVRLLSQWACEQFPLTELRLWTHSGNAASGRVAERAGYERAPEHDQPREIKGEQWHTLAYRLRAAPPSGT